VVQGTRSNIGPVVDCNVHLWNQQDNPVFWLSDRTLVRDMPGDCDILPDRYTLADYRRETAGYDARGAPFLDHMIVKGHRPELAPLVEIEQIFFHCMKALMRSQLWQPDTWAPGVLPSRPRLVKSVQVTEETLEELQEHYGPSYAERLYG
jgi:predicted pyridoxine 5'-phosphate oxidase superfamily flavin-nucleotide-binding protein